MTTPPFDIQKNLEEAIKEGLVITGATVGIFWLRKMVKIASPPKTPWMHPTSSNSVEA